jgi:hypothetical protein
MQGYPCYGNGGLFWRYWGGFTIKGRGGIVIEVVSDAGLYHIIYIRSLNEYHLHAI